MSLLCLEPPAGGGLAVQVLEFRVAFSFSMQQLQTTLMLRRVWQLTTAPHNPPLTTSDTASDWLTLIVLP